MSSTSLKRKTNQSLERRSEQREVGARVKRSGAGVLRDSNGAAAKKEATPAEIAPAAKKRKTPSAQSVAKDTKTVVNAFQTPVVTKKRAIAPVEEKTPSKEDLTLRKLTVAQKRRMEAQLELVLAKTYVRAIKRPIIPQAKPSQRLLDAYRAFSLACARARERRRQSRMIVLERSSSAPHSHAASMLYEPKMRASQRASTRDYFNQHEQFLKFSILHCSMY